jgi:hypothetical protein
MNISLILGLCEKRVTKLRITEIREVLSRSFFYVGDIWNEIFEV